MAHIVGKYMRMLESVHMYCCYFDGFTRPHLHRLKSQIPLDLVVIIHGICVYCVGITVFLLSLGEHYILLYVCELRGT